MDVSFWTHAAGDPARVALVGPGGDEHTAGAILAAANQLVHGLRARGLERGDAVAVALPNSLEIFEIYMACAQAGWYLTPINWHLAAPEIAYILRDCGAKAFVCHPELARLATAAADEAGLDHGARFMVGAPLAGFQAYAALTAGAPLDTPPDRAAGGPMTYTSGTTGHPKGVRRPLGEMTPEQSATANALFLGLFGILPGTDGVHLVVSPTYHTAVLRFAVNHLHLGHRVVLMDKWTPEGMLTCIARYRVTSSHMVPTQFNRLLKLPRAAREGCDVSSLRHMVHGAAPCPTETKRQMLAWWGDCIYEYYAASEGGGTLATPEDWRARPGTVGRPWPISQIRILDDAQRPVATGDVGTVWIRMGEHRFEYHEDAEKTRDAWHEGFFTVGDAGYVDDAGFLFLCDRKSDMIISGGVNIYPAEIEAVLVQHPGVADVAVFGIPDDDWGEQVKAVVEPTPDAAPADQLCDALLTWAADRLARYKLPRSIDLVDALPRDPNGKLYKRRLRDPYWEGRSRAI